MPLNFKLPTTDGQVNGELLAINRAFDGRSEWQPFTTVITPLALLNLILSGKVQNVMLHGATGTGSDDTAAILAAKAALGNKPGVIYFPTPPNSYIYTGQYTHFDGQWWVGSSAGENESGGGTGADVFFDLTSGQTAFTMNTDTGVTGMRMRGGLTANTTGIAFASGSSGQKIYQTRIKEFPICAKHNNVSVVSYFDTEITNYTTAGLYLTGSEVNRVRYIGGQIAQGVDGVLVDGGPHNGLRLDTTIQGNTSHGIHVTGVLHGLLDYCYHEDNGTHDVLFNSATSEGPVFSGFFNTTPTSLALTAALGPQVWNCNFSPGGGGAKSITTGASCSNALIIGNTYRSGAFVRGSADDAGSGTRQFDGELLLAPSTTAVAALRVPHGVAPSAPVNGDMWTTTAGLFVRINGATIGPLS